MGSEVIAVRIAEAGTETSASVWSTVTHSGALAFSVLLLLVAFSIVSWGIILVKWMANRSVAAPSGSDTEAVTTARATAACADNSVLDQGVLSPLRKAKPELFRRLVRTYMAYAPKALSELNRASAANDFEALSAVAHSLKSSSANLGASALSSYCRALEHIASERRIDDAHGLVAKINSSFALVQSGLERELADIDGAAPAIKAAM